MARMMISCHKGLAPISVPEEWLEGFDTSTSFAAVASEARIRFPNGKAFGVRVNFSGGGRPSPSVRSLPREEIKETSWGPFCAPWETYEMAKMFGHGPVTPLDDK